MMKVKRVLSGLLASVMMFSNVTTVALAREIADPVVNYCFCENANEVGHTDPSCTMFQDIVREAVSLYSAVPKDVAPATENETGYDAYMAAVKSAKKAVDYMNKMNDATRNAALAEISEETLSRVNTLAAIQRPDSTVEETTPPIIAEPEKPDVTEKPSTEDGTAAPDKEPVAPEGELGEPPLPSYSELGGVTAINFAEPDSAEKKIVVEANSTSNTYGDVFTPAGITMTVYGVPAEKQGDFHYEDVFHRAEDDSGLLSITFTGVENGTILSAGEHAIGLQFQKDTVEFNGEIFKLVCESTGKVTIAPRNISVIINDTSKAYGDENPKFTYTVTAGEVVTGDSLSRGEGNGLSCDGVNVGAYPISHNFDNPNYAVTVEGEGELVITPAELVITAGFITRDSKFQPSLTREYGNENGQNFGYRIHGLKNGDTADIVGEITVTSEATATSPVGTYAVKATGANENTNYTISYENGELVVAPRTLKIVANDVEKYVGEDDPEITFTVTAPNAANADKPFEAHNGMALVELKGQLTREEGEESGVYKITSAFPAEENTNYSINFEEGKFIITKLEMGTVLCGDYERYFGQENPKFTHKEGLLPEGAARVEFECKADEFSDVGDYSILAHLYGPNNEDLGLTIAGKLTVKPRPVTVSLVDKESVYGEPLKEFSYKLSCRYGAPLVGTDSIDNMIETSPAVIKNVGQYTITMNPDNPNYDFTIHDGTYSVTPRFISVQIDDKTSVYGEEVEELTYTLSSRYNGEPLVVGDTLEGSLYTKEDINDVGRYDILSSFANDNYYISVDRGRYTVNKRPIEVNIADKSSFYGDPLVPVEYTLTCELGDAILEGDELTGSVATIPEEISKAGTYTIASNLGNPNYSFKVNQGKYTIKQRPVKITIDSKESVYGQPLQELTYKMESQCGGEAIVQGDKIGGRITINNPSPRNAGSYKIVSTMSNDNYAFTVEEGTYTITPRPVKVNINSHKIVYGNDVPTLSYTLSCDLGKPMAEGDVFTGVIGFGEGVEPKNVGTYPIGCTMGAKMSNYTFTVSNGLLKIVPATISVSLENGSKLYGTTTNIPEPEFSGWKFDDKKNSSSLLPTTTVKASEEVEGINGYVSTGKGEHQEYQKAFSYTGSARGNYVFSSASADLSVSRLQPTDAMYAVKGNAKNANEPDTYIGNVTIVAANGYRLSTKDDLVDNTWDSSLTYAESGKHEEEVFVMRLSDGAITDTIPLSFTIESVTQTPTDGNGENSTNSKEPVVQDNPHSFVDFLVRNGWVFVAVAAAVVGGGVIVYLIRKKNEDSVGEDDE